MGCGVATPANAALADVRPWDDSEMFLPISLAGNEKIEELGSKRFIVGTPQQVNSGCSQ